MGRAGGRAPQERAQEILPPRPDTRGAAPRRAAVGVAEVLVPLQHPISLDGVDDAVTSGEHLPEVLPAGSDALRAAPRRAAVGVAEVLVPLQRTIGRDGVDDGSIAAAGGHREHLLEVLPPARHRARSGPRLCGAGRVPIVLVPEEGAVSLDGVDGPGCREHLFEVLPAIAHDEAAILLPQARSVEIAVVLVAAERSISVDNIDVG